MGRSQTRILLIEDDETDYLLTRRMLSSVKSQNFDLEWARSWQTGIQALRRCSHDVCLLDFRIGGDDGLELLKESRSIGCKAPVILLTGINDYRLDVEAMELGAADFLVKDKLSPELLERSIRYSIGQVDALRELQRHEEVLRASELRYRSVVQSANDAIILANDNAKITGWNKAAEMVFGYAEDEVLGSPIEVLMPESYRERYREGFDRFCVTGRSQIVGKTIELEGLRKNGTIFPLELSLASFSNGDGTLFTCIIRDMTERNRAVELRSAKEAAEVANRAKSGFVARMSHELRTPLHAIIGFTNLILHNRAGNLNSRDLEFLRRILLNAKDQLQLINGVLDLSRVEAGRMEMLSKETPVETIVQEVVEQLEGECRNANVEIVLRVPKPISPIAADAQKLKQVLMNLVENALKNTERGSVTIQVVVSPVGFQPVRIDVIDTGIGIPSDRLADIFEPFLQLETSHKRSRGTGLGLSICRSLCDLMGYELRVSSEPGRGSTFSIILSPVNQLPVSA